MTDNLTPRAVPLLAKMVARYQGREICSPLTDADVNWWTELEHDYLAALTASAGALSREDLEELYWAGATGLDGSPGDTKISKLLTTYAAVVVENTQLHEKLRYAIHGQDECRKAEEDAVRDAAALRATVAEWEKALIRIKRDGDKSSRYIAEDALALLARTPTPEGQG